MVKNFKKYEGTFFEARDKIKTDGRKVASFLDLIKEKLEGRLQSFNIVTGDAAIYLPNGDLSIDYNSRFLIDRNLEEVEYNRSDACFDVHLDNLGLINGPIMTFDQIKNLDSENPKMNPVLLALVRYANLNGCDGSVESLLSAYIDRVPHKEEGKRIMFPLLDHQYMHEEKVKRENGIVKIKPWIFGDVSCNSSPNGYCDDLQHNQTVVGKKYSS